MDIRLNDIETRVLGCLIEKQLTTPEYYPLTLRALTAACNQKSNRNPVMSFEDHDVLRALDGLRALHLGSETHIAGSRVPKYEHKLSRKWDLLPKEVAILCVLFLRGPQTPGEIRARTARMFSFDNLAQVEESLRNLQHHEAGAFVSELDRIPGHKENRFIHLLAGEPAIEEIQASLAANSPSGTYPGSSDRIAALEETVASMLEQLEELRGRFEAFKSQFE